MSRSRVLIVGAGFTGCRAPPAPTSSRAARTSTPAAAGALSRLPRLPRHTVDGILLSASDPFPYPPLLPQVGAGSLEPRHARADRPPDAVLPYRTAQLGLVRSGPVPLDPASPEPARVPDDRPDAPAAPDTRDAPDTPEKNDGGTP